MKTLLKTVVILFFIALNARANTIYVDVNATGTNDGTSWVNAFNDLQNAIGISVFGDEIWVATGTYYPSNDNTRGDDFSIKNGTKVYGGFNGTETLLTERSVKDNPTILSGEIGGGVVSDNSYNIIVFNNVANQTRLDGFVIVAAYNNIDEGGAIISMNSSPTVANCTISGNYATEGGGALNQSGSGILTIENCIFDGNVGNTYGGGALRLYSSTVNISDCYFKSNQSNTYGGAIFIYNSTVNIDKSVFAGNVCETSGSAIRVSDVGTLHLSNSLVVGNFTSQASAIYASTASNSSPHTIINCTIAHNMQANTGGSSYPCAVALNNEATITNSIIYGNNNSIQVFGNGVNFSYNITENATNSATGNNILYVAPLFINPGNVNNAPFDTTGLNYQLNLLSEGIDYGLNANIVGTSDLAGQTRIQNNDVDLGAYEKTYCLSTSNFTSNAPFTICGGTPIVLAVNNVAQSTWSTGNTNDSILVSSAGNYSILFIDSLGCRGELTASVTTSTNPTPTINYTGGNLSTGSFSAYQWNFNSSLINGATSNTHVPIQGYGNYQVDVTNASGCIGSATYCLSPVELTINGETTVCEGDTVVLSVLNSDNQVWSTGSLNTSINATTSGLYSVTAMNNTAGCSVSLSENIVVNPNPNPVIFLQGNNLTTTSFSEYQWNYNGTPISGAINQMLDPTATGNGQYTVTVTNSNGCEATSFVYELSNLGLNQTAFSSNFYFPNPIQQNAKLSFNLNVDPGYTNRIQVVNTIGKKVLDVSKVGNKFDLKLSGLESGIYFISIQTKDKTYSGLKLQVL